MEPVNFSLFSISGWGIDLDYCDDEWFTLEMDQDHSVIFDVAQSTAFQYFLLTMKHSTSHPLASSPQASIQASFTSCPRPWLLPFQGPVPAHLFITLLAPSPLAWSFLSSSSCPS